MKYDIVVVGSGVGGYPAAIYTARKGYRVAIVEEHLVGGECTNYGCVPTKALYHVAEASRALRKIDAETSYEWSKLLSWVREVVEDTRRGLEELLNKYGVEVLKGRARLRGVNRFKVDGLDIEFDKALLALGTDPKPLPNTGFDEERILSNRGLLKLGEKPGSLLIIGGGVIGVEVASIFTDLGVEVFIVEALEHILPFMDRDISLAIKRYLTSRGVTIYENTLVKNIEETSEGLKAKLSNGSEIAVDKVLVSIGRTPKTGGVGLELGKVDVDKQGFIKVDRSYRTSNPNIYSVGDVVGPPLLAHKALLESIATAKSMCSEESFTIDYTGIPQTIFSGLEVASIGYMEEDLKKKGIEYERIRLPVYFLSAVKIKDSRFSYVKLLLERGGSRVYGIHVVAPNASEIISAYLPIYLGKLSLKDAAKLPYPHLTVSESLREVAEYFIGEPIHVFVRK